MTPVALWGALGLLWEESCWYIPADTANTGANLRIAIVHARWNPTLIEPLVEGVKKSLRARGVQESAIVVQSVPGSWELPIAVQRYTSPVFLHLLHKIQVRDSEFRTA